MSAPLDRLLVFDLSTLACLLDVVRCVVINLQSHPVLSMALYLVTFTVFWLKLILALSCIHMPMLRLCNGNLGMICSVGVISVPGTLRLQTAR